MKLRRIFKLSFNLLIHSKLRSWLTVIGIIIGVAAVVSIISIGQGLQQNVTSRISGLGQDIITISAGSSRAFGGFREGGDRTTTNLKPLTIREVQTLKLVPGIKAINGRVNGRTTTYYNGETASLSIEGGDPAVQKEFIATDLASGRFLSQGDSNVIVIGDGVAKNTFKTELLVGYTLTINNQPYRIVGILAPSSGIGGSDNGVYTTEQNARDLIKDTSDLKNNEYSSIQVKVSDAAAIDSMTTTITEALTNIRHVRGDKKDFSVTSAQALQQRFSQITGALTLFLGAIAAISLLVGGIGVANTMFTSVLEKTKEIGIMKAIGAKNKDVLLIFLLNSGMLGLVGGTIGIIIGALISYILPNLGLSLGVGGPGQGAINTAISFNLLLLALLFSILIGMLSGAIPAYRASRLRPVDALRYE